ncbi:MAG: T9SS type A sorting domain-containing protein [Saprospiraceae bacterium]|nr:T9SS type A sorting domain-containing protein [Saprospiraceae bacterium]
MKKTLLFIILILVSFSVKSQNIDVGVCYIEKPDDTLRCEVIVWIKNYGLNSVSSVDVWWNLNGLNKHTQTWTGTLNPNDSVQFTFLTPSPPYGAMWFCAGTHYPGDVNPTNDSLCKGVVCNPCDIGLADMEFDEFILNQNIPNPTSGKTQISYTVSKAGEMRFELINVLGQIMQFQEKSVMPGTHTIELFVGDLAAGVYYYSVMFEGRRLVKKMVISN